MKEEDKLSVIGWIKFIWNGIVHDRATIPGLLQLPEKNSSEAKEKLEKKKEKKEKLVLTKLES